MIIKNEISTRVLTVGENYKVPFGGISTVINTYAEYFETFNFIPTYKPTKNKSQVVFNFLKAYISVFKHLKQHKNIAIVHIHGAAKGSVFRKYFIVWLCKRVFKKIVIYHSHGSEFKKFYQNSSFPVKWLIKRLITHADVVICLSAEWESFFKENFQVKKTFILENIVNPPQLEKYPTNDKLTFLFLGYVGDRKGIFDLLELISENKTVFEGTTEFWIGGNGDVKRLDDFIVANDMQPLVKYKGWVVGADKQFLLNQADVYVLPSYNEGLPISILEAMSYGLPIISTNVGGIPTIVHNNVNGFVVSPGDKQQLLDRLRFFLSNRYLINSMGQISAEIVKPYYAAAVIEKLEQLYIDLLKIGS